MTPQAHEFFIDGKWVAPSTDATLEVINPATEKPIGSIAMGAQADVDAAVAAARRAFETYGQSSVQERLDLLDRLAGAYQARMDDLAEAISEEMGAPPDFAKQQQVPVGIAHLKTARRVLAEFAWEVPVRNTLVVREPIGVVGLITPWNWPQNQVMCKVAPALAAGCTLILKPSEIAPYDALILAEIMDAAGVPAGVFNLVNGDGPTVGAALAGHPDIDMISFTGSTRAGIEVARAAAPTVKRVSQELGGKSANILLPDADFAEVVPRDVTQVFSNAGQSCDAGTRMLVPADRMDEVAALAREAAQAVTIGPVVSEQQFERVQGFILRGIDEGAVLEVGGPGRPEGVDVGYHVRPTVFSHVSNDMTIAREEIFGPVLSIIGYHDVDQAVAIANDTPYGLSGYVSSADPEAAQAVARRLRTGMVHLNGSPSDVRAPFGGYKRSGNGREWGEEGMEEFLESKSIFGAGTT